MSGADQGEHGFIVWQGIVLTARRHRGRLQYRQVVGVGTPDARLIWRDVPDDAGVSTLYATAAEAAERGGLQGWITKR